MVVFGGACYLHCQSQEKQKIKEGTAPPFSMLIHLNPLNQNRIPCRNNFNRNLIGLNRVVKLYDFSAADGVALAFLVDAYDEEVLTDGNGKEDVRTVMRFHPALAPFKAAVLPLAKKLAPVAEPIFEELSKYFNVDYDAAGSIGKRYRREDEIGTPFCICVDFDTETDGCVTIRDRDTMEQIRIPVADVKAYIEEKLIF